MSKTAAAAAASRLPSAQSVGPHVTLAHKFNPEKHDIDNWWASDKVIERTNTVSISGAKRNIGRNLESNVLPSCVCVCVCML